MPRVLLLVPTATYRTADFMAAAAKLDLEVMSAPSGATPWSR